MSRGEEEAISKRRVAGEGKPERQGENARRGWRWCWRGAPERMVEEGDSPDKVLTA